MTVTTINEARKLASVRHRFTGIDGTVVWQTETEIGIDCEGFTWTGTLEHFELLWDEQ